jgi:secreted trypsin-like serine protease
LRFLSLGVCIIVMNVALPREVGSRTLTRRAANRACVLATLLSPFAPANAMVGGAEPVPNLSSRPEVMIVGSRGNSCTGTLIAGDLVLTAAHCVPPDADYKLVQFDANRQPSLRDTARVERHPQFSMPSFLNHRATADVALIKLAAPVLNVQPAAVSNEKLSVAPGHRFVVMGFGLTKRGDGKTGGTLRMATLVATGKPGNLQIRLYDPATQGERSGLGACTGDSGAPIFSESGSRPLVIGVVSWSTGPNNTEGCGGLTGVTPLSLYRGWIIETARKLGSPVVP